MQVIITITIIMLIVGLQTQAVGQPRGCESPQNLLRRYVERVREQPSLGVEYERVARFKLASRKTTYRMGEMISVDLAMSNTANKSTFFTNELSYPSSVRLKAHDEKGTEIGVFEFMVFQLAIRRDSYNLLKPNDIVVGSLQLLADCKERSAFEELKRQVTQSGQHKGKTIFEKDLFVNWGDFCLNVLNPGKYTIVAEVTNRHVLVSPCESNVKTAVGTIRSTPLTLTITE